MNYTGYELIWLFFAYSFLGWILETIGAAARQRRFVNRGLVNAPLCVIYGVAAVMITMFGSGLSVFWLFVGSAILATVVEWIGGHVLERLYDEKWWDYSKVKWNLDGYICLPASLFWGFLGTTAFKLENPILLRLFHLLPQKAGEVVLLLLGAALIIDAVASIAIISGKSQWMDRWKSIDSWFTAISIRLGSWVYGWVGRRIERAYPRSVPRTKSRTKEKSFAAGCSPYKIILLFIIGSFLGDIVETVFCRVQAGHWMSRSSLVWGPFSIVWGGAIAAATVLLYKYKDRSDRFLFLMGTVLGGVYEYLCSVLSEMVFGTVFWDYSKIPFNLGGRINLLYCFFWGFAAVVWFKGLYPVLSLWIERLPERSGKWIVRVLAVFMCCNMAVSALALIRSDQRQRGVEAQYSWQKIMDERFDDERLEKIYTNAIRVSED